MSNLQIIEALCQLVELQNRLIHELSVRLAEQGAYTEAQKAMVQVAKDAYQNILGADEAPDHPYEEGST